MWLSVGHRVSGVRLSVLIKRFLPFASQRMSISIPSPAVIQSHIYAAFLDGTTADIALHVRGTWNAVYRLHRVVLIQSGFFQTLFTAGFKEASRTKRPEKHGPDVVDLVFDDRNITRAAFEICIARLYGGGPPLHVSSSLKPTAAHPLTPSFPTLQEPEDIPPNHHPATPRFILSLLATSIFLSIPSIATQALSLVLGTVGPRTVILYLNFALGKPLPLDSLLGEPEAAVGLETIAHPLDDEDELVHNSDRGKSESEEFSDICPSPSLSGSNSSTSSASDEDDDIFCHYGVVSNKIGEASACWLARWAPDMLAYEIEQRQVDPTISRKRSTTGNLDDVIVWGRGGLSARWVAALIASDHLFVKNERHRYDFARTVVEMRREDGVIAEEEKEWIKMFENGIYYMNMPVNDIIAISNDISPSTKQPFVPVHALQSAHWSQAILQNTVTNQPPSPPSPTLGSPSLDEKGLGLTLTTADILSRVLGTNHLDNANPEAIKGYYPVSTDASIRIGDNGSSFTTPSDSTAMTMDDFFKYPDSATTSSSHSSNGNGRTTHKASDPQPSPMETSEATFFGLVTSRRTGSDCVASDSAGKSRWSTYPPFRFAVEFWDLEILREKQRLYSNTVWYAGSLFNVYIQMIRKKGQTQLGIYLHRQSSIDPIPPPSAPPSAASDNNNSRSESLTRSTDRNGHRSGGSQSFIGPSGSPRPLHYSPSIYPLSNSSSILTSNMIRPTSPIISGSGSPSSPPSSSMFGGRSRGYAPSQPYRDPRGMILAYFTVSCASATGASQTRFSSAPDSFSISQSWGWKSSSLRTEEYMDIELDDELVEGQQQLVQRPQPPPQQLSQLSTSILMSDAGAAKRKTQGRQSSLRATVILGLI